MIIVMKVDPIETIMGNTLFFIPFFYYYCYFNLTCF